MDRFSADLMISMKHRLPQQVPNMPTPQPIKDSAAGASALDQSGQPQLRQMLTGYRRTAPSRSRQAGYIQLL